MKTKDEELVNGKVAMYFRDELFGRCRYASIDFSREIFLKRLERRKKCRQKCEKSRQKRFCRNPCVKTCKFKILNSKPRPDESDLLRHRAKRTNTPTSRDQMRGRVTIGQLLVFRSTVFPCTPTGPGFSSKAVLFSGPAGPGRFTYIRVSRIKN